MKHEISSEHWRWVFKNFKPVSTTVSHFETLNFILHMIVPFLSCFILPLIVITPWKQNTVFKQFLIKLYFRVNVGTSFEQHQHQFNVHTTTGHWHIGTNSYCEDGGGSTRTRTHTHTHTHTADQKEKSPANENRRLYSTVLPRNLSALIPRTVAVSTTRYRRYVTPAVSEVSICGPSAD